MNSYYLEAQRKNKRVMQWLELGLVAVICALVLMITFTAKAGII